MKERQKMEVYGEGVPMWQFRILMAITPFYISFSFLQRHLADKMQMCEGHSVVSYALWTVCRELSLFSLCLYDLHNIATIYKNAS